MVDLTLKLLDLDGLTSEGVDLMVYGALLGMQCVVSCKKMLEKIKTLDLGHEPRSFPFTRILLTI